MGEHLTQHNKTLKHTPPKNLTKTYILKHVVSNGIFQPQEIVIGQPQPMGQGISNGRVFLGLVIVEQLQSIQLTLAKILPQWNALKYM